MSNEDNVIDVEEVELGGTPNLPVVIEQPESHQSDAPIEAHGGSKTDDGRDWPHGPTPDRRCRAHKKTGEQCKNAAILGSTVCRFHGGAAKHVKAAARARLENAADLMAKQLLGIAIGAESETVKLTAIRDALDRAGLKPPAEVVLSQGETKPYEELFDGISSGSRAESRRARGIPDVECSSGPAAHAQDFLAPPASASGDRRQNTPAGHENMRREYVSRQDDSSSNAPPRQPEPHESDRERDAGPPVRHITGDDAVDAANWANRRIGALKALPPGRTRK